MATGREETRGEKRRQKILQASMRLFVKKGSYSAASTTDICTAAHVSRPSLYHYFGNKSNLLLSLHLDEISRVLEPYLEGAAAIPDPLERLTYMVRTYTGDVICRHPELRVLIHDASTLKDRHFRVVRQQWKRHYEALRSTIAELREQGVVRKEADPSFASLFLLGMMTWITFWLDYDRTDRIDEVAERAVDFVLHGLKSGFEGDGAWSAAAQAPAGARVAQEAQNDMKEGPVS